MKIVTINGPCGIWGIKHSSKNDEFHECKYNRLRSENSTVDLLYFEVWADKEGFCGQSAIPISSLRTGYFFFSSLEYQYNQIFL